MPRRSSAACPIPRVVVGVPLLALLALCGSVARSQPTQSCHLSASAPPLHGRDACARETRPEETAGAGPSAAHPTEGEPSAAPPDACAVSGMRWLLLKALPAVAYGCLCCAALVAHVLIRRAVGSENASGLVFACVLLPAAAACWLARGSGGYVAISMGGVPADPGIRTLALEVAATVGAPAPREVYVIDPQA